MPSTRQRPEAVQVRNAQRGYDHQPARCETVIIGGLIKDEERKSSNKIPLLVISRGREALFAERRRHDQDGHPHVNHAQHRASSRTARQDHQSFWSGTKRRTMFSSRSSTTLARARNRPEKTLAKEPPSSMRSRSANNRPRRSRRGLRRRSPGGEYRRGARTQTAETPQRWAGARFETVRDRVKDLYGRSLRSATTQDRGFQWPRPKGPS